MSHVTPINEAREQTLLLPGVSPQRYQTRPHPGREQQPKRGPLRCCFATAADVARLSQQRPASQVRLRDKARSHLGRRGHAHLADYDWRPTTGAALLCFCSSHFSVYQVILKKKSLETFLRKNYKNDLTYKVSKIS